MWNMHMLRKAMAIGAETNKQEEKYGNTSEMLQVRFQITAIKRVTKFFGFPVHMKVIFTLYCSLLSVQ
jgi:hypothetical protein